MSDVVRLHIGGETLTDAAVTEHVMFHDVVGHLASPAPAEYDPQFDDWPFANTDEEVAAASAANVEERRTMLGIVDSRDDEPSDEIGHPSTTILEDIKGLPGLLETDDAGLDDAFMELAVGGVIALRDGRCVLREKPASEMVTPKTERQERGVRVCRQISPGVTLGIVE